jgi:NIMA (never in mitosis gene a)-related kinase
MHRDIKSQNVYLFSNGQVKIGDLNVSKECDEEGLNYSTVGTPYYTSPEEWKDDTYNEKIDIWASGCILFEMAFLRPPFVADKLEGIMKKVIKGDMGEYPLSYTQELRALIQTLLK